MQNFKVQHQTLREMKMLFRLLQPIILISTTNSKCKQWKISLKISGINTLNLYVKTKILYCLWNNQKMYIKSWHLLASYQILKTLENQELIYKMQRIEKMQNIYQIYLNEINKVIEFGDFAKKLTATQPMSHIIWNVKCVTKNKHILGKQ